MGILGLSKLIREKAPSALKEHDIKEYSGRKVAIDASIVFYQSLNSGSQLTNAKGEVISHIAGLFDLIVRLVENGIAPVVVFDGKPPNMKSAELEKRAKIRSEAEKRLVKALEEGDEMNIEKYTRQRVKRTPQHMADYQKVLGLMGVPVVNAPGEAEAQCAELARSGRVYAAATEDMDALPFRSNRLLRGLTFRDARKIQEFTHERVLSDFRFSHAQFVDLCILLGSDYCESIGGVGPKTAFDLIEKHGSIEEILKRVDTTKYSVPERWRYREARRLFLAPDVSPAEKVELKWTDPDEKGLVKYLVEEKKCFSQDRIRSGVVKLMRSKGKGARDSAPVAADMQNQFSHLTLNETSSATAMKASADKLRKEEKFKVAIESYYEASVRFQEEGDCKSSIDGILACAGGMKLVANALYAKKRNWKIVLKDFGLLNDIEQLRWKIEQMEDLYEEPAWPCATAELYNCAAQMCIRLKDYRMAMQNCQLGMHFLDKHLPLANPPVYMNLISSHGLADGLMEGTFPHLEDDYFTDEDEENIWYHRN